MAIWQKKNLNLLTLSFILNIMLLKDALNPIISSDTKEWLLPEEQIVYILYIEYILLHNSLLLISSLYTERDI